MVVKSPIRDGDEPFVEFPLVRTTFIPSSKEDGLPLRIECKRDTPYTTFPRKPQFLHVGVTRALEGIYSRTAEIGAEILKQSCVCEEFVLQILLHCPEFCMELGMEEDGPAHAGSMAFKPYGVKLMSQPMPRLQFFPRTETTQGLLFLQTFGRLAQYRRAPELRNTLNSGVVAKGGIEPPTQGFSVIMRLATTDRNGF